MWLNDGCCVRLRPEHENHVWSYDFVSAGTHDGRLRLLTLIDDYTRKSLAIRVARLNSYDLIETLADLMLVYGIPQYIRSDIWARVCCRKTAKLAVGSVLSSRTFRQPLSAGQRKTLLPPVANAAVHGGDVGISHSLQGISGQR